jgi:hypothetical protein
MRDRIRWGILICLLLSIAPRVSAQETTLSRKGVSDLLRTAGVKVTEVPAPVGGRPAQELRIRWETIDAAAPIGASTGSEAGRFASLERRAVSGELPQPRSFELSSEQLLVAALDAEGRLQAWALIVDPRLLRTEAASPPGELRGETLYRPAAEFWVALPSDREIATLRFFQPRWTGKAFTLTLLGSAPLSK